MYELNIFCENKESLEKFLNRFYGENFNLDEPFFEKQFESPIDMIDIISVIADNSDIYDFGVWISVDKNIFIYVTEQNLDKIIRYFYERYPY